MFRYIALVWNVSDGPQVRTAETLRARLSGGDGGWRQVFQAEGLDVYCAGAERGALKPHPLPKGVGIVLGYLFERNRSVDDDSPSQRAIITGDGADAIVASGGRWLVEHCWGNYVAFVRAAAGGRTLVLKDPTGTLPCFTTQFQGATIVFSHIGDCRAVGPMQFTVSRRFLHVRAIGFNDLESNTLDEVDQVHRGECVAIDPAGDPPVRARQFYWNPFTFTQGSRAIEDRDRAARAMRATVRACTRTLAASHDSVLHRLSGGLDSSIVAGCLAAVSMRPRVLCYTYYNPVGRSDERPWAKLAAEHAGLEHVDCAVTPAAVRFRALLEMPEAVEPIALLGYLLRSSVEAQLATERHATAVLTGDGGDSGFCSDSLPYLLTDYLQRHGLGRDALRLASQVALRTDRSTWRVLIVSIHRALFGAQMREQLPAIVMGARLLTRELRESFQLPEHYPHPWFAHLDHVPWATIRRLGILVATPEFYSAPDPNAFAPEIVSPLYSQPALELFLRIPIYVHAEDGNDRGLARRGFAREVPQPILRRQWKDRAPGFHSELLHRNLDLIREVLLDGVLVRERVLDRCAIEHALSPGPSKSEVLPVEIYRHLELELWARQWLR